MSAADDQQRAITVWDVPTRLFHWLVVALVARRLRDAAR